MSTEESKMVQFLDHPPAGTNPYLGAANLVDSFLQLPNVPKYSTILTACSLVTYSLMGLQVAILYYQRQTLAKLGKSRGLRFNKLGLVVVETSVLSIYCYGIYAPVTLIYLLLELFLPHQVAYEGTRFIMFAYKFLVILTASWIFLWNAASQCALLVWESEFASRVQREKLQASLKWGTNIVFVVVALAPWPVVLWAFGVGYQDFKRIESTLNETKVALVSAASDYNPETYSAIELWPYLIPARKAIAYMSDLEHHVTLGIKTYAVALTLLALFYIPLLSFSLISLWRGSRFKANAEHSVVRSGKSESSSMIPQIRKKVRTLVYHALWVYTSTLIHLPVLVWFLYNCQPGFEIDPKRRAILNHGLTIPFSISGNMALAILIINTRNVIHGTPRGVQRISLEAGLNGSSGGDHVVLSPSSQKEFGVRRMTTQDKPDGATAQS